MIKKLHTDYPDSRFKEKLMLFGQFIGDWKIESQWFLPNNISPKGSGEVHFGWILDGNAIQDVWMGKVENPPPGFPETGSGTTIRFYDSIIDKWQCIWIAPKSNTVGIFIAQKIDDEIILEGKTKEGYLERWIYSEITAQSFQWRAVESYDNKKTWKLVQKISAKKVN